MHHLAFFEAKWCLFITVLFNLRKYPKIHLAEWNSFFSPENNIGSRTTAISGYYHRTTHPLKTCFICLQLLEAQEDRDPPKTGSLSANRPSPSQWRSAWPCTRQRWPRRRPTVLLLWWDDASMESQMPFQICWQPPEKCISNMVSLMFGCQYSLYRFKVNSSYSLYLSDMHNISCSK